METEKSPCPAAQAEGQGLKKLGYTPALDGLRGVAIAMVVSYHAGWLGGGWYGVDVFFVLSGFLITTLLLEERAATGRIDILGFYVRRARRLMPALAVLLIVVVAVDGERELGAAAAGAVYVSNIVRAVDPQHLSGPLGHLWSLAQEEQFYLVWPGLLVLLARSSARKLAWLLAVAAVTLIGYRIALLAEGASAARLYFAPVTHADPLVLGCLLAVAHRSLPRIRALAPAAVALLAVLAAGSGGVTAESLGVGVPLVSLCTAALIVEAVDGETFTARLLSWRPLVWLGSISYSLYLWHQFARELILNEPAAIAAAILVAWLGTRFIERRFRTHRAKTFTLPGVPARLGSAQG